MPDIVFQPASPDAELPDPVVMVVMVVMVAPPSITAAQYDYQHNNEKKLHRDSVCSSAHWLIDTVKTINTLIIAF